MPYPQEAAECAEARLSSAHRWPGVGRHVRSVVLGALEANAPSSAVYDSRAAWANVPAGRVIRGDGQMWLNASPAAKFLADTFLRAFPGICSAVSTVEWR